MISFSEKFVTFEVMLLSNDDDTFHDSRRWLCQLEKVSWAEAVNISTEILLRRTRSGWCSFSKIFMELIHENVALSSYFFYPVFSSGRVNLRKSIKRKIWCKSMKQQKRKGWNDFNWMNSEHTVKKKQWERVKMYHLPFQLTRSSSNFFVSLTHTESLLYFILLIITLFHAVWKNKRKETY